MDIRLTRESNEIVLKNQGLVRYLAEKFIRKIKDLSWSDFDDLISEGNIGLMKAATTFDSSKGKFSTYASKCINNEILQYLRKEKRHQGNISLDSVINEGEDGSELTLKDVIPEKNEDFSQKLIDEEMFSHVMSIILNFLEPRERKIALCKVVGANQRDISKELEISQSYVSRLEARIMEKVKKSLMLPKQYEEVFFMTKTDNKYRISFSSKKVGDFNKIFATLLQKVTPDLNLPDFDVRCNKDQIIILLPAEQEAFSFIAQIMQEIDEFNIRFVSCKTEDAKEQAENKKESNKSLLIEQDSQVAKENIEEVEPEIAKPKIKTRKESKYGKIKAYILEQNEFTLKELMANFKGFTRSDFNNAIVRLKQQGAIISIARGKYRVNKT